MEDDFARALARFGEIAQRDRSDAAIDPVCVPQLHHHGKRTERAIVFFHGFTNCPAQFGEIARAAHGRGANVYVPRLPKHGYADKETTALETMSAIEVEEAGLEAVTLAAGLGERVDVLGLSIGGTLAAWLAQTCALGTAVAVAPFFAVKNVPSPLEPLLEGVLERLPDFEMWWDPRKKAAQEPRHGYPRFATHALAQAMAIGDHTAARARDGAPLGRRMVLAYNPQDPAVNNEAPRKLWSAWSAAGYDAPVLELRDAGERHDIIEPETFPEARTLIYPALLHALFA